MEMLTAMAYHHRAYFPLFSAKARKAAAIAESSFDSLWLRFMVSVPAHWMVVPGLTKDTRTRKGRGSGPPVQRSGGGSFRLRVRSRPVTDGSLFSHIQSIPFILR